MKKLIQISGTTVEGRRCRVEVIFTALTVSSGF